MGSNFNSPPHSGQKLAKQVLISLLLIKRLCNL
jgi:hypothetical protein